MSVHISKDEGLITQIRLDDHKILDDPCSIYLNRQRIPIHQVVHSISKSVTSKETAKIKFVTKGNERTIVHTYMIDTIALRWEINIDNQKNEQGYIEFSIPTTKSFEKIFHYGHGDPFDAKTVDKVKLIYRKDLYIPMISNYSFSKNIGLSIVVPFELPKPHLQFNIDSKEQIIIFDYLQEEKINGAVYIIPHEGDWRPGLDFVSKQYPKYFQPTSISKIRDEWYYLSHYDDANEIKVSALSDRGVKWIEVHEYFPFYGLYIPKTPTWGIIINSHDLSLAQWEADPGTKRNSLQKMNDFIKLWHKYGIQVFMYFQSAEAWNQYAEKYFTNDIALDIKNTPLPAYPSTNLMNPDPDGKWGQYIINQARNILETFPEIDGIFYDRLDYDNYDFAHNDGITMINKQPAYMLAFGQERINKSIFDIFHKKGKAIWGNIPTSIEVCQGLDGIMAEKNLRSLLRSQYLSIARPLIYLPYDALPGETEEKLKYALLCGATISVTYGGPEIQHIESKYKSIFDLLKKRKWVLNASCLKIPENLRGNIYRTPDNNYVITLISTDKFQNKHHPFEYNDLITVRIPDAEMIRYAYLLSGDWEGINEIEFNRKGKELQILLPYHLATSAIYLTRERTYELVRLSAPILIKGTLNEMIFKISSNKTHNVELQLPWVYENKKTTANILKFNINVPENASGERDIMISVDGKKYHYTSWVAEPVSLVPKENIFLHHREGEDVPFYLSNNMPHAISLNFKGSHFAEGGEMKIPKKVTLAPYETKHINIWMKLIKPDNAVFTALYNNQTLTWSVKANAVMGFSADDLFQDDFTGGMKKWTVATGTWNTSMQTAQASGPTHFACILNDNWKDYVFEATVRCRGSSNSNIDWLKSYIFFRVQDKMNYYRYGIQGNTGVLSLYKRVDGKWHVIHMVPFMPKKGKWYTLKVHIAGKRIICYIDNEKVMSFEDGTFSYGGIGIGVLEDAQQCDYKNIIVRKP